jgi:hypothetical protein
LNSGDALTFPRLEGSSVVDKEKTSEKLCTVLMIFSSVFADKGDPCEAYALHLAKQLPRQIQLAEGIEGGAVMTREGTEVLEWWCKECLVTQEVPDVAGPDSKYRMNVEFLRLLQKFES